MMRNLIQFYAVLVYPIISIFCADCFVQDGLDGENDKMNMEIKKQKKKLNKLMDKVKIASLDLAMRA